MLNDLPTSYNVDLNRGEPLRVHLTVDDKLILLALVGIIAAAGVFKLRRG